MELTEKQSLIKVVEQEPLATQESIREEHLIQRGLQGCLKSLRGRVVVGLAWVAFMYMYCLTVFWGIWNFELHEQAGQRVVDSDKRFWASISTAAYSALWLLMIWSHIASVMTNPGHMPKHY